MKTSGNGSNTNPDFRMLGVLLLTTCTLIQAADSSKIISGETNAGTYCLVDSVDSARGGSHSMEDLPFSAPSSLGKVTDNDPDFPSLFFMEDGTPVTSLAQWESERAPELLGFMESQYFGATPAAAKNPENWTTSYSDKEEWDAVRFASDIYKHYNPDWAAKYDFMSEFSVQLPEQRVVVDNQVGFSIDPEGHNMDGADIETIVIWSAGRGWLD